MVTSGQKVAHSIVVVTLAVSASLLSAIVPANWTLDGPGGAGAAWARSHHRSSGQTQQTSSTRHHSGSSSTRNRSHKVASAGEDTSSRHHGRHHGKHGHARESVAAKPKYAYPYDIFMMTPPEFDHTPLPEELCENVRSSFVQGTAENYPPNYLVRSGVARYHPLRGGLFKRREHVKYIVVHSTETGVPQDAPHVIEAWSSGGRRHPGAQYIIDRDGTIYETSDPDTATVHVNIFKTLPGINNDNSIGIEMCHTGRQDYPAAERESARLLVSYLQDRYHVLDENVITHRYAQQGDHTDPVNFDWEGFLAEKDQFRQQALAYKSSHDGEDILENDLPVASVYLEMHLKLRPQDVLNRPFVSPDLASGPAVNQMTGTGFGSTGTSSPVGDRPYASLEYTHADRQAQTSRRSSLPLRGEIELPPQTVNKLNSNSGPASATPTTAEEDMEMQDADNAVSKTTTNTHGTLQYTK
jgi:hypothetical protein